MKSSRFLSISEFAKALGVSRVAIYKKIKKGQIKAIRIGRQFAIPSRYIIKPEQRKLKYADKARIKEAVRKTVREYGETLRLLGRE